LVNQGYFVSTPALLLKSVAFISEVNARTPKVELIINFVHRSTFKANESASSANGVNYFSGFTHH